MKKLLALLLVLLPSFALAQGTRDWSLNPGGDGSFWVTPFQNGASWITSGPLITALRGGTPAINVNPNFSVPWVRGVSTDPLVRVTDGTKTINVHIPLGTVVEGGGDFNIGGADSTQPYLVWSMYNASINTGSVAASGTVITGGPLAINDGSGAVMMDAVTGETASSNNTLGASITDYDLSQANASSSYVIPHMLQYSLDPSFQVAPTGPIWPLKVIDTSESDVGPMQQGYTIGIPASTPRPTGQTRGFYLLWDQAQQFGLFFYNVANAGGTSIQIYSTNSANTALANQVLAAWPTVMQSMAILNATSGTAGAQYSTATIKGMINGVRNDAFTPPPTLNYSATGGVPPTSAQIAAFGAWYSSGYTTPWTPNVPSGGGGGGTESVAGTTVPPSTSINASPTPGTAGSGNVLTIVGGVIDLNGVTLGGSNVVELYYTGSAPGANGATSHSAYQENAAGNWYGPITASSTGGQVSSPVPSSVSNNLPDLSNALAHPVTGIPTAKVAYSIDLYPTNLQGQTPDSPIATMTPIWNTYFGRAAASVPVITMETGCSCDGTTGSLTDDNAFMAAFTAYVNGSASGGPSFTTSQQPMSTDWLAWGNFAGVNPDGTLNTDNVTLKVGQQTWWSTLLFGTIAPPPPPPQTTWNPGDESGMTLSGNNLIATSGGVGSVRSTTSKSSGKYCWAITANTITNNWDAGVANATYSLTAPNGLGGDANGIGFDPNSLGGDQGIFYNNVLLSSGSVTSANGDVTMMCADFTADLFWATSAAMQASTGAGDYNNTAACNPTVAACGKSFSGLTGPFFITFNEFETGGVATLGTLAASLPYGLPSGFSAWDTAAVVTGGGRPMSILIMGDNDNHRPASNDDAIRIALNSRSSRQ